VDEQAAISSPRVSCLSGTTINRLSRPLHRLCGVMLVGHGLEFMDVGVVAPEGGLRGWICRKRCDGGDHSLRSYGWLEWTVGDPSVGGASALTAPRSRFEGLTRDSGRPSFRERCEVFSRRKLYASAPMAVMPAGVVTLQGASLWLSSPR
jgi:hypothetical protein